MSKILEQFNLFDRTKNTYAATLLLENNKIIKAKFKYDIGIVKEYLEADRYKVCKIVEKNKKEIVLVLHSRIMWRRFILSEFEEKKLEKTIAANKFFRSIDINAKV